MKIKILGAHNLESRESRCLSILIDDVLAIDAGCLTSSLDFTAQQKLRAVLLTHQHYDHIRDIPALAINYMSFGEQIDIYGSKEVRDILARHFLNGQVYPAFMEQPPEKPPVRFHTIEPGKREEIDGYSVDIVPVKHAFPTVGLQITGPDGKAVFYSSDTGPGLSDFWRSINSDLLIMELTLLNARREFALESGHLTPALLREELNAFREIKGYLPEVLLVHMNPMNESSLKEEMKEIEKQFETRISFSNEGLEIVL